MSQSKPTNSCIYIYIKYNKYSTINRGVFKKQNLPRKNLLVAIKIITDFVQHNCRPFSCQHFYWYV